jgi:hypothetical protein
MARLQDFENGEFAPFSPRIIIQYSDRRTSSLLEIITDKVDSKSLSEHLPFQDEWNLDKRNKRGEHIARCTVSPTPRKVKSAPQLNVRAKGDRP